MHISMQMPSCCYSHCPYDNHRNRHIRYNWNYKQHRYQIVFQHDVIYVIFMVIHNFLSHTHGWHFWGQANMYINKDYSMSSTGWIDPVGFIMHFRHNTFSTFAAFYPRAVQCCSSLTSLVCVLFEKQIYCLSLLMHICYTNLSVWLSLIQFLFAGVDPCKLQIGNLGATARQAEDVGPWRWRQSGKAPCWWRTRRVTLCIYVIYPVD